jgi:hypothetical protein
MRAKVACAPLDQAAIGVVANHQRAHAWVERDDAVD